MINAASLRPGNTILIKNGTRIIPVTLSLQNFHLPFTEPQNCFAQVLNEVVLKQSGFLENEKYPLRPATREFRLTLAVPGSTNKTELVALLRDGQENFGRYFVNDTPASIPFRNLHELENLVLALTGAELR